VVLVDHAAKYPTPQRRRRVAGDRAGIRLARRPLRSAREIAQALFVTVQTVELHLTNSYRKLGVSGRA
jgi:hypothetical protein